MVATRLLVYLSTRLLCQRGVGTRRAALCCLWIILRKISKKTKALRKRDGCCASIIVKTLSRVSGSNSSTRLLVNLSTLSRGVGTRRAALCFVLITKNIEKTKALRKRDGCCASMIVKLLSKESGSNSSTCQLVYLSTLSRGVGTRRAALCCLWIILQSISGD